jgi:hypothetical protein
MKITGRRIFTAVTLVGCAITLYQLLSKPLPVAAPQNIEDARTNAASFDHKIEQLSAPRSAQDVISELRFTSDEVNAEIAEATGALPAAPAQSKPATPAAYSSPDAAVAPGEVQVKSYQVKLEGDVARGQFVTAVAGKDVYVTLAGHLGSQDGYVTFDPTEFKIGDLNIPVSLVNSALQKKLAEQRAQLKLPDGVGSLRIDNGELVLVPKQ